MTEDEMVVLEDGDDGSSGKGLPRHKKLSTSMPSDDKLAKLPIRTRYTYAMLLLASDIAGKFSAEPEDVMARCYPYGGITEAELMEDLRALHDACLIDLFLHESMPDQVIGAFPEKQYFKYNRVWKSHAKNMVPSSFPSQNDEHSIILPRQNRKEAKSKLMAFILNSEDAVVDAPAPVAPAAPKVTAKTPVIPDPKPKTKKEEDPRMAALRETFYAETGALVGSHKQGGFTTYKTQWLDPLTNILDGSGGDQAKAVAMLKKMATLSKEKGLSIKTPLSLVYAWGEATGAAKKQASASGMRFAS